MSLSVEQEFMVASFERSVQNLSEQEAKEALVFLHRNYLQQKAAFAAMLADAWGIGDNAHNKIP